MRKLVVLLSALLALWAAPSEASAFKGYYYNSKSLEEIASAVESSLARDASGNALIAPAKCRRDASCATAAAYLESFRAHDPEAGLTSVSQVAGYIRSLIKDCSVTGKFEMDAMDVRGRMPRARVSGMSRAIRPGECVYRNPKTGRIVLAEHCANPIGRALDNPCVYVDFRTGPEIAAHIAVVDATDVCLGWRKVASLGASDDGKGWANIPDSCGQLQCNFEDVSRASGRTFGRIGGIPLASGNYQLRLSRNNFVAICLEYGASSSFTAGVRQSDYKPVGRESHARIFYQSNELPRGVSATDDAALFFWASTPAEAERIHARYGQ